MMQQMGEYIFSAVAAAMILSIVSTFVDQKGSAGSLVRLIGGLYLMVILVRPLANFDLNALERFWEEISVDTDSVIHDGEKIAAQQKADIIKAETTAYILDKAGLYAADLQIEVILSEGELPVPESVIIRGQLPTQVRQKLVRIIEQDLNIPKENQTWIGLS